MRSMKFTLMFLIIFGLCVREYNCGLFNTIKNLYSKIKKHFERTVQVVNGVKNEGTINLQITNNINVGGTALRPHAYLTNSNEYEDASEVSDKYEVSVENPITLSPGSEGTIEGSVSFGSADCNNPAFQFICVVYFHPGELVTSDNDACTPIKCASGSATGSGARPMLTTSWMLMMVLFSLMAISLF